MQRILKLGPADFLTGIAPTAHIPNTGLFYEAPGITTLFDIGQPQTGINGLLIPGAPAQDLSTNIVDTILAHVVTSFSGTPELYMLGSSGHFYKKDLGNGAPTDLRSATPITSPEAGITVWGPAGGTTLLYYFNNAHIGTWNLVGTYPTGWTDSVYTSSTIVYANTSLHKFVGNVYYGGAGAIGAIIDNGDTTASHSSNVLDFDPRAICTGLTDDGRYLVIAITANLVGSNMSSPAKIYFWDTFSDSWNVEYEIKDPYIWAVKNIGGVVYAFGKYGVYQVTFNGGVKPIMVREISDFSTFLLGLPGSGLADIFNNSMLIWANLAVGTIDTYGKFSPEVPVAYMQHFNVPGNNAKHMIADFDIGRVYVATNDPKLYAFDFGDETRLEGITCQTVFFQLDQPWDIKAVRVVFAEPLSPGDQVTPTIFSDSASIDFPSITYSSKRETRSKTVRANIEANDQFSLQLSFDSGFPLVKKIEVFGVPRDRADG